MTNLSPTQMRSRCKSARLVTTGRVSGYRIGFTRYSTGWGGGVADLIEESEGVVWGTVYELSGEDLKRLDDYEGVPWAYRRFRIEVMSSGPSGEQIFPAWAYVVVNKGAELEPSEPYRRTIVDGARDVGLPPRYIASIRGHRL